MSQTITDEKIIRLREVLDRTGLSRSMAYALIEQGQFPRPISLGARAVGWFSSQVDAWIASRVPTARHASNV
ncbi:MAG: AlpA family transcriptional regulator [Proteobacteria bacterium]|jgi:prophage regulatory protein|nr:AlpA family transcriptional regulator [Alphaproteobacteria bacterium]NCC03653.1 AlpA family transcriptional regulator [Pseudomonadota bacterium]